MKVASSLKSKSALLAIGTTMISKGSKYIRSPTKLRQQNNLFQKYKQRVEMMVQKMWPVDSRCVLTKIGLKAQVKKFTWLQMLLVMVKSIMKWEIIFQKAVQMDSS